MDFSDSLVREALMDTEFNKATSLQNRLWAKVPIALFLVAAVILIGSLTL